MSLEDQAAQWDEEVDRYREIASDLDQYDGSNVSGDVQATLAATSAGGTIGGIIGGFLGGLGGPAAPLTVPAAAALGSVIGSLIAGGAVGGTIAGTRQGQRKSRKEAEEAQETDYMTLAEDPLEYLETLQQLAPSVYERLVSDQDVVDRLPPDVADELGLSQTPATGRGGKWRPGVDIAMVRLPAIPRPGRVLGGVSSDVPGAPDVPDGTSIKQVAALAAAAALVASGVYALWR